MGAADLFASAAPAFAWCPNWSGETAIVIASGPSASVQPIHLARGRARVVAVNNSWRLAPWADCLYACDYKWWRMHRAHAARFKGLKISQDRVACEVYRELRRVHAKRGVEEIQLEQFGHVAWAGNSGFQALNLVAQWGPSRILLVGFDMTLAHGVHWHGKHAEGMTNPSEGSITRWRRRLEAAAKPLAAFGVEVLNCSEISALENYRKVALADALGHHPAECSSRTRPGPCASDGLGDASAWLASGDNRAADRTVEAG